MYQLADLYKQSKEVDIFTMGKGLGGGGVQGERIRNFCFSYLDDEQCMSEENSHIILLTGLHVLSKSMYIYF
jgi:hypothetical protein